MNNGFVQFKDEAGNVVTTNGSLTLLKVGSRNLAFYGSKGRSALSDAEFAQVLADIGVPVPAVPIFAPAAPSNLPAAKDDDDFVMP